MMTESAGVRKKAVWPFRRCCQLLVLALLVLVPWLSHNPQQAVPSRIVLGQLPEPVLLPVTGDTWAFEVAGFRLLHPVAFLENWLAAKVLYLPALVAVILPLLITLTLGRVFCSWLCPVGLILEWNMRVSHWFQRLGWRRRFQLPDLRYLLLAVCLGFGLVFAMPFVAVFDPPHVLGRELMYWFAHHQLSRLGVALLGGIVLFEWLVASRGWCRWLCPSGGGLALLGRLRVWRIEMHRERCSRCEECNHACPYRLAPMSLAEDPGRFDWLTCDNCGRCRDHCPTGALGYRLALVRGSAGRNREQEEG